MVYLDNAATTFPKPASVVKAVQTAFTAYGANPGRSGHRMSAATAEKVYDCREALADFFHAYDVTNVIFTQNCTHALNIAIKGILHRGDHVVISTLEHNSVLRPIHCLATQGLITYSVADVVEGDDDRTVENFASQITARTRLIACTHASNVCGIRLPIEKLGQLAKRYGILFLVDAAQTAGVLPIDIQKDNIDFLCMAGHKCLYGPSGTGVLITDRGDLLRPLMEGGTGSNSLELEQPEFMPDKFESGTLNTAGIIGLGAGLSYLKRETLSKIYQREMNLTRMLYDGLSKIKGVILYTKRPDNSHYVPVICFNLQGMDSFTAVEQLDRQGIALRGGYHCAPLSHQKLGTTEIGAIRASLSSFTTAQDIQRLLGAVKIVLQKGKK